MYLAILILTITCIIMLYFESKIDDTKDGSFLWYNWKGKKRYKKL